MARSQTWPFMVVLVELGHWQLWSSLQVLYLALQSQHQDPVIVMERRSLFNGAVRPVFLDTTKLMLEIASAWCVLVTPHH
jgi:hypothetical protein